MNATHYDLIVIGGGPAGEKGGARAAYFGKRVALIERSNVLGGTTVGGAVPSKTLRETALNISGLRHRGLYGVDLSHAAGLDIATFMYRERHVHSQAQNAVADNLERHHIHRYVGSASFVDQHTVRVNAGPGEVMLTGDVVLIATGSRANRSPLFPYHNPNVYDADTILTMSRLPRHLAVVGGGVVGCEFACLFRALGIEVTLFHTEAQLFRFVDQEIAGLLRTSMEALGIRVMAPVRVARIEEGDEREGLRIALESGEEVAVDAVMAAVGRVSNVEELALENAGVATGKRGAILVNAQYQTNVPHIYAAGDVIGFPALASTAMEQARVAMAHAFHLENDPINIAHVPYGIWTIPEISMVGKTEEALQAQGTPYVVGRARYRNNPRGMVLGDEHGMLKLIFAVGDRTLLGVHIIGQEACELIALGLLGMETRATLANLINVCFNYPSLGDMYKYAAYDAWGRFDELERGEAIGEG